MVCLLMGTTSKSIRNLHCQTASLAASQAVTYLTSIVELAIQDCLILLHIMVPLSRVNTEPQVDFLESLSNQKSDSMYPIAFNYFLLFSKTHNHIVSSSSKIFQNILDCNLVFGQRVGLISGNNSYYISNKYLVLCKAWRALSFQ